MNTKQKPIVRFAPSPTGPLHIGGARTALFNYIFAKQTGGKFILRIEDTDKERSEKKYEEDILSGLEWLGIKPDEIYKQSERTDLYQKHLDALIKSGAAYVSREAKKDGAEGEIAEVVRFKNPNKRVTFQDMVRGEVSFDTTELKDFVIARSVSEPLYHLAVVVDDFEMKVTHVIRGEDHISNTPRQILIQEALGATRPLYAHLPLILAPDRSKLSKRKHGEAVSLAHYRNMNIAPEAMLNFLALLGWHPSASDASEVLSFDDLVTQFQLQRVQKGGAVLDGNKLNWLNRQYLKKKDMIVK
ncbi:MAG: glutamate--tRNA ligase family protein [bacterium]|nr:glutamate--tRNA ligase family protein [bacterium]